MSKGKHYHCLLLSLYFCLLFNILTPSNATDQVTNLYKLLKSKRLKNPSLAASWVTLPTQIKETRVHVGRQDGLKEADKITSLPGQPDGVDFDQYAGYVTVDPALDKALFYYFVESPNNSSSKPLVLWLNGETTISDECKEYTDKAWAEAGNIDIYNIYAPVCLKSGNNSKAHILDSVELFDPCSSTYVDTYLNTEVVQKALHVKPTEWVSCSGFDWQDSPSTVLPVIQKLMASNISVWMYSGDVDGRVPVTSTKYSLNTLKLPIKNDRRPWYDTDNQVRGYVVGYEGLVFLTVRGAGHLVPSYQPERALTMISLFLRGTLPPKSS